jgi:hypothetical protein
MHLANPTPLPTSPASGKVPLGILGTIAPHPLADTSPMMGEARRGWGHAHQRLGGNQC